MAITLFELGFVLKAVEYLSGTLKKIETQMEAVNATAAAPWRDFAGNFAMASGSITAGGIAFPLKDAVEKAGELEHHLRMARLATAIGNVPDKPRQLGEAEKFASEQSIASGYEVNQLTESLDQGLSGFLNMTQAMAVSVEAIKLARGTTGELTGTTSLATLSARGLSGETAGEGFLEIMTQMSRVSKRLGFEVFAGPNRQRIDLLKTLQGIQRQVGDIGKNNDIAAAFEKAFGAGAVIEWGVNLLKAERLPARSERISGAQRIEQTSRRGAFKVSSLRAAQIAIENVVTRMRSYLPFSPARLGPLREFQNLRIVETIAESFQPAPMLAAIRRVAAAAAVTMPMMIGGAAMPAAGALSSPSLPHVADSFARLAGSLGPGAVVLNYAPHVEVHTPGGPAATLEKAVMEALEKNRREVYRMLEQVAGRRERTRYEHSRSVILEAHPPLRGENPGSGLRW